MQFSRRFLLTLLFCASLLYGKSIFAQETNIIDLCTEERLLEAFTEGGIYRLECEGGIISINLTSPIIVTKDVTLIATNEILLNGQNLTRLMVIRPGVKVSLEGFSFFSGRQTETNRNNGGIDETAGGAIYNDGGHLTLRRCRFQANSVLGITGLAAEAGTGESGEAGGDAAGGAIYNKGGTLNISNVVFVSNSTIGGVGGNGANGRTSGFGQNGGNGGVGGSAGGGAIYSIGGRVEVYSSTFTNNTAVGSTAGAGGAAGGTLGIPGIPADAGDGVGAAITGENTELIVVASTFSTNSVRGANALAGNAGFGREDGHPGLPGGDGAGGAIYSTGNLWLTNSTFFRNAATSGNGGNGGAGSASGFGYAGGDGGNGGVASGGAVESKGPGAIVNCTFSDNNVTAGTGGTGGAGVGFGENGDDGSVGPILGEAVYASGQQVILANTILAFSSPTIEGNLSDLGGNITTDRNSLINTNISFRLTNPRLQTLANNGGPTPTMALRTNSIAINAGVEGFCTPTDQRGTNRVGRCDIGAFEYIASLTEVVGTNGFQLISVTNGPILLRWPAGHTNIVLQGTTNLTRWVTITNGITETNNFLFFTISPDSGPYTFYRLFSPTGGGTSQPPPPPPPNPGGSPIPPVPGTSVAAAFINRPAEDSTELFVPPSPPQLE